MTGQDFGSNGPSSVIWPAIMLLKNPCCQFGEITVRNQLDRTYNISLKSIFPFCIEPFHTKFRGKQMFDSCQIWKGHGEINLIKYIKTFCLKICTQITGTCYQSSFSSLAIQNTYHLPDKHAFTLIITSLTYSVISTCHVVPRAPSNTRNGIKLWQCKFFSSFCGRSRKKR